MRRICTHGHGSEGFVLLDAVVALIVLATLAVGVSRLLAAIEHMDRRTEEALYRLEAAERAADEAEAGLFERR